MTRGLLCWWSIARRRARFICVSIWAGSSVVNIGCVFY